MKNCGSDKRNPLKKHNRLNVGRIALERLVEALISCSLLQSAGGGGRGSLNGTKKFNSGLQTTTLEVNIQLFIFKVNIAGRLPENSRNRFVDRQSKKTKRQTKKIRLFIEG